MFDLVASAEEDSFESVCEDVCAVVAYMGVVVYGRSTSVHTDLIRVDGDEFLLTASERIVQTNFMHER